MSYTDILKEAKELKNNLCNLDEKEIQISRLVGIIMDLKASIYFEPPEDIIEKIKRIQL